MASALNDSFAQLHPTVRSYALVGQFLYHWSGLEATLNNCIERAFDLTSTQGIVLTRNIQLRDKINILKTVVDVVWTSLDEDPAEHKKKLGAIYQFANVNRNMIAHDLFIPDDKGDGVHFLVVKAKGEIAFPNTRWSIADFQSKVAEIDAFDAHMQSITPALARFSAWRNASQQFANAVTRNALAGPGIEYPQPPLTPEPPNSPNVLANPKTEIQTPPSSDQE